MIPLSLSPEIEIEIRLRGHPGDPSWGTAFVFCAQMDCGFGNRQHTTEYGESVNRLRIYDGVARGGGRGITLSLKPPLLVGQFDFVIDR